MNREIHKEIHIYIWVKNADFLVVKNLSANEGNGSGRSEGEESARILEWVIISSSRSLPNPGTEPTSPALAGSSLPLSHLGGLELHNPLVALYYNKIINNKNKQTQVNFQANSTLTLVFWRHSTSGSLVEKPGRPSVDGRGLEIHSRSTFLWKYIHVI